VPTGLVRFGARDYDPETGAFITPDPSGFAGGLNLYQYAAGDPINLVDITGHNPLAAGGAAIGGVTSGGYNVASQLQQNGGNWGCINWGSAAMAAVEGAMIGSMLGGALRGVVGLLEGLPVGAGRSGPWVPGVVRPGGSVAQSHPGSCVSACGEMLTGGARSEAEFLASLGQWSNPKALASELGSGWTGGFFGTGAEAIQVARQGEMGAVLWAPGQRAGHMVVIRPSGAGFVVRDPDPGVNYTVGARWIGRYVAGGVWRP
jgi:hypothetical protein